MSDFGSSMGKLTIEQCGTGWIVCEDGRRVGGTVRHPLPSQAAAQRYVDAELKGEAETMAAGDVGLSARAQVIRGTDPKVWAKIERIEKKFASNHDAAVEAHIAAGTFIVMVRITTASLEAEGILEGAGERDGQRVYRLAGPKS
jgi:hypothetical protein